MDLDYAAHAYLVKAYLRTSSGTLMAEPDTVCFDLDLALEIAASERESAEGLAVYALGEDGMLLSSIPVVSHGLFVPDAASAARPGAAIRAA